MKFSIIVVLWAISTCQSVLAQSALPDEIPENFLQKSGLYDHERTEVMIPMRDGVKLFTVIWHPKIAKEPMPIVLTRTPYVAGNRQGWTGRPTSPTGAAAVPMADAPLIDNGYIRVYQDIRGKNGSEGAYSMNMPPRGPLNSGKVDQSTDAYDTVEWLLKNIPGNNGNVGMIGVSYEGWTTLMALLEPHPALKAAIPMNPMVDGWMGDDWYHNGAFRQFTIEYVYNQTTIRGINSFPLGSLDTYAAYLKEGSAVDMAKSRGMENLPTFRKIIDNPAYTDFWKDQAVDKLLSKAKMTVPTLTVHGSFDQEDIYGPIASYLAMEEQDKKNNRNYLVFGPWFHGQQDPWFHTKSGSKLGAIKWGSDTTKTFLYDMMLPFFDLYLKGQKPSTPIPPVRVFDTGKNTWHTYTSWPPKKIKKQQLHFSADNSLTWKAENKEWHNEYISDPAKPVPYRVRPIIPSGYEGDSWYDWLVDDQRQFETRPDVLTYVSSPLENPVTVSGEIIAHLVASTSGEDSDWVVKLIDVYPDEYPLQTDLGGYQLMIAGDIFRGRYREDFSEAKPIQPNKPLDYEIRLPNANHTFRPGHRIMVQIQSSWFPLYDRNPQTFVPNIAYAPASAYQKATQRVYQGSYIELPIQ